MILKMVQEKNIKNFEKNKKIKVYKIDINKIKKLISI